MKTMPPAQAEHQLTRVADRFADWRQRRTMPADRISHAQLVINAAEQK